MKRNEKQKIRKADDPLCLHSVRKASISLHFGICTKLFEGDSLSPVVRNAEKAMLLEAFRLLHYVKVWEGYWEFRFLIYFLDNEEMKKSETRQKRNVNSILIQRPIKLN